MKTIGIYMPRWLYRSDKTDQLFADELFSAIKASGRYKPKWINLPALSLSTSDHAKAFCERYNLALIIQHDSAFYSTSKKYMQNVRLLEGVIPLMNSCAAHEVGHNKIATKRILREKGIPVLDDAVITSAAELEMHMQEGAWYVVKPPNNGAGTGVRLIKKEKDILMEYRNGGWHPISMISKKPGSVTLRRGWNPLSSFTYAPMLIEPYFNDDVGGFASLRCTVVGNEVVEAVKRINRKNITSNVSNGGKAEKIELTSEQRAMALAAARAIGADYAGVDFLVSGGKSVMGEINIGPFTVFTSYTGAPVGKVLAAYAMRACDARI